MEGMWSKERGAEEKKREKLSDLCRALPDDQVDGAESKAGWEMGEYRGCLVM